MAKASAAKRVNGKIEYRGKTFRGFNKPQKSSSKNKAMEVLAKVGDEIKVVQFGDPNMAVKSGIASNKKSYCARSSGIKGKNNKFSANYWSRKNWKC